MLFLRPFQKPFGGCLPTLALCKLYTNVSDQKGVGFFQESTGQGFGHLLVIGGCFRGHLEAIYQLWSNVRYMQVLYIKLGQNFTRNPLNRVPGLQWQFEACQRPFRGCLLTFALCGLLKSVLHQIRVEFYQESLEQCFRSQEVIGGCFRRGHLEAVYHFCP